MSPFNLDIILGLVTSTLFASGEVSEPVSKGYLPLLALLAIAVIVPLVILSTTHFLGPRKPSKRKLSVYESGMPPIGGAHSRFSVKFYIVAMTFILFDVEVVFLYPWAVLYKKYVSTDTYIFFAGMIFILLILVGFIYEWKKGALNWESDT